MEKQKHGFWQCVAACLLACGVFLVLVPGVSSQSIGGDCGWYVFHSHADGTIISLDSEEKGVVTDGELAVPIYITAAPYATYTAVYDADGYHESITKTLPPMPGKGERVDIYLDIIPAPTVQPTPAPRPIGGDEGWYDVYCNVPGALVFFDGEEKGMITGSMLAVPVYTTGTPYSSITVSAPDYVTVTKTLEQHPAQGETIDLYITLNRENDIPMMAGTS